MCSEETKQGTRRQFKEALQALALNAESQVKCTEPGDVPVEIVEDYSHWSRVFKTYFSGDLDSDKTTSIDELRNLVEALPDAIFTSKTNIDSMQQFFFQNSLSLNIVVFCK